VLLSLISWAVPLAWVLAIPPSGAAWDAEEATASQLGASQKLIERFVKDYGETPYSITELRTFATLRNENFSAYDAFGNRLEYIRLDPRLYILRSFGRDGRQNTPATPRDPAIGSLGKSRDKGLVYRFVRQNEPATTFYPAPLLVGADSPNSIWTARLYVDKTAGVKRLLVRHHGGDGAFFMVAPHDGVEEFVWMPSGYQIVFTAAQSSRYRDGIYLWNLLDDSMINLIDAVAGGTRVGMGGGDDVTASIAAVTVEGPVVYAYVLRHASNMPIAPAEFFRPQQLVGFRINDNKAELAPADPAWAAVATAPLKPQDRAFVFDTMGGNPTQSAWLGLPTQGDAETTLAAWQHFTESEAASPMFAYSLWYLASLYGQAGADRVKTDKESSDIMRSYGAEVAKALSGYSLAPRYLRLIGADLYNRLMESQPMEHAVGQLAVPVKKKK
jgi:hypothetical protein